MNKAVPSLVYNSPQANRKYNFCILINPNFCGRNSYFYTKEVWNKTAEMSPKVKDTFVKDTFIHVKDTFTLISLIPIKAVLKSFESVLKDWEF